MPTTAQATFGAGRVDPLKYDEGTVVENVNIKVSTTLAAGTLIGEIVASPGVYAAYASGNVDGTQNWTHILQYPVVTDASGNVFIGTSATSEWGQSTKGAPAYRGGEFSCADIPNLDANALLDATSKQTRGKLLQGTVSAGRVALYGR